MVRQEKGVKSKQKKRKQNEKAKEDHYRWQAPKAKSAEIQDRREMSNWKFVKNGMIKQKVEGAQK